MERIIKLADLEKAVDEVYRQFKDDNEGEIDPRVSDADPNSFGISVTLTDGTVISRGDTEVKSAMGAISKIPGSVLLLSQLSKPDELVEKMGCCCKAKSSCGRKPEIPVNARGVRMVSAIQPTGDSDGKWDLIINNMINLMGSAPELDDKLYESLTKANKDANVENVLAEAEYYLYDNAPIAIDIFTRMISLKASASQMSAMAATIAADGLNPLNGNEVFDGSLSSRAVALMAGHGPHRMNAPWLFRSGIPAKRSFAGGMCGVFPGAFGIAAYSPLLNPVGIPVRAAKSIATLVTDKLGISVFGSARVRFEK